MRPLLRSILAALLLAVSAANAQATSSEESADTAVDAFLQIGATASGVPISPSQARLVKDLVACAVDGKSVGECAKQAVIKTVLREVGGAEAEKYLKDFTGCAFGGGSIKDCVSQGVVAQLPAEVRPMALCMADGGNVLDCGKKLVVGQVLGALPKDAQPMGECILLQGKSPGDCAKDFALKQVSDPTAKQISTCVLDGTPVADCVKQAALSAVPDAAKPLADCMAKPGADAGACAKEFAVAHVDPQYRKMVTCLSDNKSAEQCAKEAGAGLINQATQGATQEALDQLEKLKADSEEAMEKNLPGTIRNIIILAQGIHDGDWEKMVDGGGPEVAKLSAKIVLIAVLGPELAPVIGPIVDAFVDNRVELMRRLIQAASNGDVVAAGQAIFEFYEITFIEAPCALIPDGGFKDATCGNFAKAVVAISEAAGDVAKKLLGWGKDLLEDIGLWQLGGKILHAVGDFLDDVGDLFSGDDDKPKYQDASVCGTGGDYYANNYLTCLVSGADAKASGSYSAMSARLTSACSTSMGRCYANAAQSCEAMAGSLTGLVDRLSTTLTQGADGYVNATVASFAASHAAQACDPDFWNSGGDGYELIYSCTKALTQKIPWNTNHCAARLPLPYELQAPFKACQAALGKVDLNALRASMRSACEAAKQAEKRHQDLLSFCNPVRTTPDGKSYQMAGSAWTQLHGLDCLTQEMPWLASNGRGGPARVIESSILIPEVRGSSVLLRRPGHWPSELFDTPVVLYSPPLGRLPFGRGFDQVLGKGIEIPSLGNLPAFQGSDRSWQRVPIPDLVKFPGRDVIKLPDPDIPKLPAKLPAASLGNSVSTPPKLSPSGAGSSGFTTVKGGENAKPKRSLRGGDAAALPSAKLPSGVGSSGISTSRQPDAAPSKTGTRKKKKLDDPAQAKLPPAKLPSGVGSSGISTSRQPDGGSSAMDRLSGDGMGPGRVGPSGGGSSGISTSRSVPQPSGGGSSGISTSRQPPQPSGGGSSGISLSRPGPQPSGGGSSGVSLSRQPPPPSGGGSSGISLSKPGP